MPQDIKYVAIDNLLGRSKADLNLMETVLANGTLKGKKILLLNFPKGGKKVEQVVESYLPFESISLEDKANSADIKSILQHFGSFENKTFSNARETIQFGKSILYLDALSSSFIRRFESNQECPGFWNLAVGTFCRHSCRYCFLNLTMRMRPLCIEHLNLSHLKANLTYFNKKRGAVHALLNAGETSDPLDNEPILRIWNKIVTLVQASENQILCLTKSANVDTIPDSSNGNLRETVIYSWSINPPSVVRRYELNTASAEDRIAAAHRLSNLGYRIRFRIDPILPPTLLTALSGGNLIPPTDIDLEEYYALIDQFDRIQPEMVTLGTFRALPSLFNFLEDAPLKKECLVKNGKRFRIPKQYRHYLYEQLGTYAQDLLGCHLAICKDPTIDLPFSTLRGPCQCLKLNI